MWRSSFNRGDDHAARTLGTQKNVYIYQSRWFEDQIPEVAKAFDNLIWTEKKVPEMKV
jgi:hypothetical protein